MKYKKSKMASPLDAFRRDAGPLLQEIYGADAGGLALQALASLAEEELARGRGEGQEPGGGGGTAGTEMERSQSSSSAKSGDNDSAPKDFARACLIAYADSIIPSGCGALAADHTKPLDAQAPSPLRLLADFMHGQVDSSGVDKVAGLAGDTFPVLHILPFYPWDTDRGFSVKDYCGVDPRNGTWEDIGKITAGGTELMFDFVANHASVSNPLVQGALISRHAKPDDCPSECLPFKDFVIAFEDDEKPDDATLALLARPRPHPVLTRYFVVRREVGSSVEFQAILGDPAVDIPADMDNGNIGVIGGGWVWTTFSRG